MLRIVITMRTSADGKHDEIRDCLSKDWSNYIKSQYNKAILIPLLNQPSLVSSFLESVKPHLLILTNGEDLHSNKKRDDTEFAAVDFAIDRDIPILGVCRGMQVLNYFFGGLIEKEIQSHVDSNHEVTIIDDELKMMLKTSYLNVNSYHNQGIKISGLSKEFKILGLRSDIVELIKHKTKNILGIQWHPERENRDQELTDLILKNFIKPIEKEIIS